MARRLLMMRTAFSVILFSSPLGITPGLKASAASARSASVEPSAGAWKTWVIASGARMQTPAPPGPKATKEEVAELLSLQARRGKGAPETIRYWDSGSPSYRWNEIAFKAAADSSSGVVTERMLALLNVAIYDAMVAAWHAKYKYNRRRPSEVETKLSPAVPVADSPSYPSEHAVAAGAASAVLSYLFPDKAKFLADKAEECGHSRLLAGVQYRSDVTAGLRLGREVAALVIERAKADGSGAKWAGSVPNTPGLWNGKNPYDPQMARWKTWVLSSGNQLRPGPPAFDAAAMAEVREAAKNPRARREAYYWAITSLPRYWNDLASLKIFENKLDRNPPQAARVYAVLSTAYYDSLVACWDAKYAYWGIRPFQYDPEFKPLITTPNFPGYPSGHAMLSGTAASMLAYLLPADSEFFNKQAAAAAESRLLGGVHFRLDNDVGLKLGRSVAAVAIARARADGAVQAVDMDGMIRAEMERSHAPGAVAAVAQGGRVIFSRGYGFADVEKGIRATPETPFYVGSVTKQFTAAAVMMLVEEGKVALDDRAIRYLPKLPMPYEDVSVRHLLTHTSGVRRDFKEHGHSLVGDSLYEALASAPLDFAPGRRVSYSTTGYILLGMLVEAVSKRGLKEFLAERIFRPLGMNSTRYVVPGDTVVNVAAGYEWAGGQLARVSAVGARYGAGAVVSTAADLVKWDAALYGDRPLGKKARALMWAVQKLPDGSDAAVGYDGAARRLRVGYGWFVSDYLGHRLVHHGGNLDGYSAQFDRFVDDRLTFIVLANNETGPATVVAKILADHYVPDLDLTSVPSLNQRARFAFYRQDYAASVKLNNEAVAKGDRDPLTQFSLARGLSMMGEQDKAFSHLLRAVELGFKDAELLRRETSLEPLRGDPRWADVLERVPFKPTH